MDERNSRILVVDDEIRYVKLVRVNLEASGYEVLAATNGDEAVNLTIEKQPDLILLDIMLPGQDGYAACQEIRRFSQVPIIMVTAFEQTENLVKGLDAGADDYITKPFSAQELLARIRAVLRRASMSGPEVEESLRVDGIEIDFTRRRVYVDGEEVHLTPTEYRLLSELVRNSGRVLVPDYLLERVWDVNTHEPQLLWQAMHRLRQKIEPDPSNPTYIHTRTGIGYIFMAEERTQDA
ncbi:MAG: response regulator transcription factor [Anaerolineae bacterium]